MRLQKEAQQWWPMEASTTLREEGEEEVMTPGGMEKGSERS
jgi:hypothetical protein